MQPYLGTFTLVVDGERRTVTVAISLAYQEKKASWCDVSAPGILDRDVRIAGEDALQARALAFGFVNRRITALRGVLIDAIGDRVVFDESYDLP